MEDRARDASAELLPAAAGLAVALGLALLLLFLSLRPGSGGEFGIWILLGLATAFVVDLAIRSFARGRELGRWRPLASLGGVLIFMLVAVASRVVTDFASHEATFEVLGGWFAYLIFRLPLMALVRVIGIVGAVRDLGGVQVTATSSDGAGHPLQLKAVPAGLSALATTSAAVAVGPDAVSVDLSGHGLAKRLTAHIPFAQLDEVRLLSTKEQVGAYAGSVSADPMEILSRQVGELQRWAKGEVDYPRVYLLGLGTPPCLVLRGADTFWCVPVAAAEGAAAVAAFEASRNHPVAPAPPAR